MVFRILTKEEIPELKYVFEFCEPNNNFFDDGDDREDLEPACAIRYVEEEI